MTTQSLQSQQIGAAIARYSVSQDYGSYTESDHETWQTAAQELASVLIDQTAVDYVRAVDETGMSLTRIPRLEDINRALQKYAWEAIVVEGFIPPDVFMLLQANQILPITRSIRSKEQLGYTPVPDIIHEAAGHLPMLHNSGYRRFLKRLGEIGANVQLTQADMSLYERQKQLAELLADDDTSATVIREAEQSVRQAVVAANSGPISAARKVARFHWWTVEYGLIGPNHDIFGAGLLSSVAEARAYQETPHLRLSIDCCNRGFDIDHAQPIYYVAESWEHLLSELEQLETLISN